MRLILRLINSHIADVPISLRELLRVATNKDRALLLSRNGGTTTVPCGITKVTYHRQKQKTLVENDHLPQNVLSKMIRLFLKFASMLALGPL
jgi:hypothetical protein